MMDIVIGLIGLLLGGGVMAWAMSLKLRSAAAEVRAAYDPQLATLNERLSARDRQVAEQTALLRERELRVDSLQAERSALQTARAELEMALAKEREAADEKLALLKQAEDRLKEAFKALSADVLKNNSLVFMDLAKSNFDKLHEMAKGDLEKRQQAVEQIVRPVRESLDKFDTKIQDMEKARVGAYEGLKQQVTSLQVSEEQLRKEAANLVKALGTPRVRGRWGEIQLRRVVELAGMLDHCDFHEQASVTTEDGRLRPDLVVHLPGGKHIVVDAKAPLAGYLEALEASTDEIRDARMDDHARHIREHLTALSRKAYWDQFQPAPEFVVLFLPGETFFSAALERDPSLLEQGVEQRVILATPTTLITLLKAVSYGWRQETLADHAREISDLGKELYKRLADMTGHFEDLGARLGKAVESYNKAIGSLETRVLVSARRFHELKSTGIETELASLAPVESVPRRIQAAELTAT